MELSVLDRAYPITAILATMSLSVTDQVISDLCKNEVLGEEWMRTTVTSFSKCFDMIYGECKIEQMMSRKRIEHSLTVKPKLTVPSRSSISQHTAWIVVETNKTSSISFRCLNELYQIAQRMKSINESKCQVFICLVESGCISYYKMADNYPDAKLADLDEHLNLCIMFGAIIVSVQISEAVIIQQIVKDRKWVNMCAREFIATEWRVMAS
uniref:AlNc14C99G5985 protein n=1 Tax=Albugo laibachii Nc14 TaxID=890382 RepID=F0WHC1_9STRA|nr:AlNc14C99G5985 [Albugo laibachii Nc14]|eukprot:CCA20637.1 AlNc14C99G5985 [Albugo laibachii Nc14]